MSNIPTIEEERAVSMAQVVNEHGETRGELARLFSLVEAVDWREPIDAWVDGLTDLVALSRAVVFFTATVPTFEAGIGRVRVLAEGYRAGPAGP